MSRQKAFAVVAISFMLLVQTQLAFASSKPKVLVVVDVDPLTKPRLPLGEQGLKNLEMVINAHRRVHMDVDVYYRPDSKGEVEGVLRALEGTKENGDGIITPAKIDAAATCQAEIESWLLDTFGVDKYTKTSGTPFVFVIVIGHGELVENDRCLYFGKDRVNFGNVERFCKDRYLPSLCVYEMCATAGVGDAKAEFPKTGSGPRVIPIEETASLQDIEKFCKEGRELPGAPASEPICTLLGSAIPTEPAPNDGDFIKTYCEAFALTEDKQKFKINDKSELPLRLLTKNLLDQVSRPEGGRQFYVKTNRRAMTPAHVIASTNDNFQFQSPALDLKANWDPAKAAAGGYNVTFEVGEFNGDPTIAARPQRVTKPYGSVNCTYLFKASNQKSSIATSGKVLWLSLQSERQKLLRFQRNSLDGAGIEKLADVGLNALEPTPVRVPKEGSLEGRAPEVGVAMIPIKAIGGAIDDTGWHDDDLVVIKQLWLCDKNMSQQGVKNWLALTGNQPEYSLNERWIPQDCWRSSENVAIKFTPSGQAPEFSVETMGHSGLGGPLSFINLVQQPKGFRNPRLEVTCSHKLSGEQPAKMSVLLYQQQKLIASKTWELKDTERTNQKLEVVDIDPQAAPDYMAVVISGQASIVLEKTRFGYFK